MGKKNSCNNHKKNDKSIAIKPILIPIVVVCVIMIVVIILNWSETVSENFDSSENVPEVVTVLKKTAETSEAGTIHNGTSKEEQVATVEVSKTQENKNRIETIGTWYAKDEPNNFYKLYRENDEIYLNYFYYSDYKKIRCVLSKIKGKEYIFRGNNGLFRLSPGTSVYIGKGFEECVDENGYPYKSNIILVPQNNNYLIVYMNDYEKSIYDEFCIAYKK